MTACESTCKPNLFCRHGGVQERAEPPQRAGEIAPEVGGDLGSRLSVAAAVATGFTAVLAGATAASGRPSAIAFAIAGLVALGSIGIARLARRPNRELAQVRWGSLYLMATSLAIALIEFLTAPTYTGIHGVSWNAVWVAFFPVLVPCAPRYTLIKSLIAATATPIAFAVVAPLRAVAIPDAAGLALLFVPVYLAAVMAWVAARFIDRLGSNIREARAMGLYELEERLETGGVGEVWRARHQLLARPAAIKLVKPRGRAGESQIDAVSKARFEREAQVTAALQSPHTVQLYDFGVTADGVFYYVMELLEGMDLDQLVRKHGPMPASRVVHILKQALDSLAEAHDHGLVHRDIKPGNIHLSKRGVRDDFVKVLDFGLVKRADDGASPRAPELTGNNEVSGTPAFMAPEIITGDRPVDGRADLYALGCVAYWLLTGELVFPESTAMAMAIAHATTPPDRPSSRTDNPIPRDLEELVMRCLAKHPDDRPSSARALLGLLDDLDVEEWDPDSARRWWSDSGEHPVVRPIALMMN